MHIFKRNLKNLMVSKVKRENKERSQWRWLNQFQIAPIRMAETEVIKWMNAVINRTDTEWGSDWGSTVRKFLNQPYCLLGHLCVYMWPCSMFLLLFFFFFVLFQDEVLIMWMILPGWWLLDSTPQFLTWFVFLSQLTLIIKLIKWL